MNNHSAKLITGLFCLLAVMTVAGCDQLNKKNQAIDPIDKASNLTVDDYKNQLSPQPIPQPVTLETKIPELPKPSEVLLTPQKPRLGVNKTVSISVTEDVPLKDVFIELARLADVDIEIDPRITGGVIFKAKNRPFDEVVERISDLAGLRYSIDNGIIKIERDVPYVENYQANFLNLIRTSTGKIDIDTKTLGNDNSSGSSGGSSSGSSGSSSSSSGSGSSSAASATGSVSSISSKNGGEGDIWSSIEKELNAIIGANTTVKAATATASTPATAASNAVTGEESFITTNREAGVISVRTTAKNQAKVKEYLEKVRDYYSSQVLIEAKVIEISLNDEFRSGVDWSILSKGGHGISVNPTGFPAPDLTSAANSAANNISTISFKTGDLTGAVQLAQIFGTTKTLSSPRILVMNNQQAVLNFSINENYFTVSCSNNTAVGTAGSASVSSNSITSTLHTIPIGIILGLQPSIDTANNEVTMNIHPTLSRLTGITVDDPAAAGCNAINASTGSTLGSVTGLSASETITSSVPQVDIREMDSVLRVKSGEVMAIGGMIDQKNNNTDSGLPLLGQIPILGYAFKSVDKENTTTQTIIFLKATIVPGYGVDSKDQQLYNKFNNDPHPMAF